MPSMRSAASRTASANRCSSATPTTIPHAPTPSSPSSISSTKWFRSLPSSPPMAAAPISNSSPAAPSAASPPTPPAKNKCGSNPSRTIHLECGGLACLPQAGRRFSDCSATKTDPCTHRSPADKWHSHFWLPAFPNLIYRSLSRLRSSNADKPSVPPLILKLHVPRHQRVQRIVLALPNVHASLMLRPALPHQNRSRIHKLSAKALHAQPLSMRIPPVGRRSAALLMCHDSFPLFSFPHSAATCYFFVRARLQLCRKPTPLSF